MTNYILGEQQTSGEITMGQEQSLPEDYNTEFDPEAFLKKLKEQAAADKAEGEEKSDGSAGSAES
ncbi:hypothetical protein ACG98H_12645 [Corynebacterium sp. L4756]|uniref:hypothetical protein n=1 Tax=unclassified Corynebacterium TaxID=2624378 RepID=UPI00374C9385